MKLLKDTQRNLRYALRAPLTKSVLLTTTSFFSTQICMSPIPIKNQRQYFNIESVKKMQVDDLINLFYFKLFVCLRQEHSLYLFRRIPLNLASSSSALALATLNALFWLRGLCLIDCLISNKCQLLLDSEHFRISVDLESAHRKTSLEWIWRASMIHHDSWHLLHWVCTLVILKPKIVK